MTEEQNVYFRLYIGNGIANTTAVEAVRHSTQAKDKHHSFKQPKPALCNEGHLLKIQL